MVAVKRRRKNFINAPCWKWLCQVKHYESYYMMFIFLIHTHSFTDSLVVITPSSQKFLPHISSFKRWIVFFFFIFLLRLVEKKLNLKGDGQLSSSSSWKSFFVFFLQFLFFILAVSSNYFGVNDTWQVREEEKSFKGGKKFACLNFSRMTRGKDAATEQFYVCKLCAWLSLKWKKFI